MSVFGDELYFTSQSPDGNIRTILRMDKVEGRWQNPSIASFSGQYHDIEAFLAPDALSLYYASNRPLTPDGDVKDYDIWYVQRTSRTAPWSEPINIGSPINTGGNEFFPAYTNSGNLYFTSDGEGTKGRDDIFLSKYENGAYATPVSLDTTINSEGYEFNAYVTADESILIFSGYNREDGQGQGDLYVSYKDTTGMWEKAINLGEQINSPKLDYCPHYDSSTNTLYWTSSRSTVKAFQKYSDIHELLKSYSSYQNGQNRLYKLENALKKE